MWAFSFELLCMYGGWHPVSSVLKRGDKVMACNLICPAPGNCTRIVIAKTIRSLLKIVLLTFPLELTRVPCATVYYGVRHIPTQLNAGIHPLRFIQTHERVNKANRLWSTAPAYDDLTAKIESYKAVSRWKRLELI
jgi:hypothetical protein